MLPGDLGLQDQRDVDGAVGRNDPVGVGTREQHSGRVLMHLVGEISQRDNKPLAGCKVNSIWDYFETGVVLCPWGFFRNVSLLKQVCRDEQPNSAKREFG